MSLIKFLVLLWKRSLSLLKGSRLLVGILIVFQIVVSVAFIVSYATMFINRSEEDKATMSRRPFEVSFKTPIEEKDIISKIEGKMGDKIYNASVFFRGTIDKVEVDLEALLYPQNDPTVVGEKITEEDNKNAENKLIAPMDTLKYEGLKIYDSGDKVLINNIEFAVIGNRANDFEIPVKTGIDNFKIDSIEVKLKNGTDNQDFLDYGQYFEDTFKKYDDAFIEIPPTPQQRTGAKLSLHIILGAVMLITALISFIFVFSHIINQCKYEYIILNICGAPLRYTGLLMLTQMVFQFTFSYLIAVILIPFLNIFNPKNSIFVFNLRFDIVLTVYVFSVLAIFIISLSHIAKMVKNSIYLNKQSNEGERI